MKKYINERDAAEFMSLARQTLANWCFQRKGPPYIKLGRSVCYDINDLELYMTSRKIDPMKS